MKTYLIACVIMLSVVENDGLEKHMICKSVEDVFESSPFNRQTSESGAVQGPPGKRGATGVKGEAGDRGEKGDRGSPAIVDYEHMQEVIEEKVNASKFH